MRFYSLAQTQDQELQLIPPSAGALEDFMTACAHPGNRADPATHWSRSQVLDFIRQHPGGIEHGDTLLLRWPGYHFWLSLRSTYRPIVPIAGTLSLRIGIDEPLQRYWGHIGYGVFPVSRGNRYAERACRLIMPLARQHGLSALWITANPDNIASRRTCERLGGVLVETVDVPPGHYLYEKGERQKCRYRVDL